MKLSLFCVLFAAAAASALSVERLGRQTDDASPPSNIPDVATADESSAVFVVQTAKLLESSASLEQVWDVILDFAKYPEWNPFARSQVLANDLFIPLSTQDVASVAGGVRLIITASIPPLPLPVDASTPLDLLNTQYSFENISYFDSSAHVVAWQQIMIPDAVLNASRWTAVSEYEGQVYLESYEQFKGPLAYTVQDLYEEGLREGFERQVDALELRLANITESE